MNRLASHTYWNCNAATAQHKLVTRRCPPDMFSYRISSAHGGLPVTQNWLLLARYLALSTISFPAVHSSHLRGDIRACVQASCSRTLSQLQQQTHEAGRRRADGGSSSQYPTAQALHVAISYSDGHLALPAASDFWRSSPSRYSLLTKS